MAPKSVLGIFPAFAALLLLSSCVFDTYKKEDGRVYYKYIFPESIEYELIPLDADARSFKSWGSRPYGKDRFSAFYLQKKIKGADAKTFHAIDQTYAADRRYAYRDGKRIPGADGSTFQAIDFWYSADARDVFYEYKPLHVADRKNWRKVENTNNTATSTDGRYYYFGDYRLPSADYAHIEFLKFPLLAKDSRYVYTRGHTINYDGHGRKIIDTVDAATFTAFSGGDAEDKFGPIKLDSGRAKKREKWDF